MSFARLPQCQVREIFACLGPDFYHLRGACLLTRNFSNFIDLPLEILRWHCANSDLLDQKLPCFEVLGRIPLRCSRCEVRARTRQMYRYNRAISDGNREGMLYLCWNCALEEARLFLTGKGGYLIALGGADRRDQATLFVALVSRTKASRAGFAEECLLSMRAAQR